MPTLPNGGHRPPHEPTTTLDEMLENDVRDAINLVEEVDADAEDSWIVKFLKNFGEQLAIAVIVAGIFFAVGVWWNSEMEAEAGEEITPEVNIGVDPNVENETTKK